MKKRRFQSQSQSPDPSGKPGEAPKSQAELSRPSPAPRASANPSVASSEPFARRAAIPALLFALLAAFVFWADVHIMGHGGELDARVHYPFNSVQELDSMHPKVAEDPRPKQGKVIYDRACAGCHQTDGGGGVSQNCPPLAASDWVTQKDPVRLIHLVLKGGTGPIVVSGKTWSGGTMTPFEESFNDGEIAAILSYIRTAWGNKAPLVDEAHVAKVRKELKDKDRRGVFTADELLAIPLAP